MNIQEIIFLLTAIFLTLLQRINAETQEVIAGTDTKINCTYPGDLSGKGIIIELVTREKTKNEKVYSRIAFVKPETFKRLAAGNGYKTMDSRGFTLSKLTATSFQLLIPKVAATDEGLGLRCTAYGDDGVGERMWSAEYTLKIAEPPLIKMEPSDKVIKRELESPSKEDLVIKCSASGKPRPTVTWKRKDSKTVLQTTTTNTTDGRSVVELRIKSPISVKDDGEYLCTATVDSEILRRQNKAETTSSVKISVLYKPRLNITKTIVYTDLNAKESLKIDVRGNPMPELNCSMLRLPEPKKIRMTPFASHHRLVYDVIILSVKPEDIREYKCVARNNLGTVTKAVRLTLDPSEAIVLSGNETSFSDYYQLHWKVISRAEMRNVTVEIHVRNDTYSKLVRTDVFNLSPNDRSFRHHVVNLTDNMMHEFRMKPCNNRGCSPAKKAVFVRTQKNDGTNTVDPSIVKVPVTDVPVVIRKVKDKNSSAAIQCSIWLISLSGIIITLASL